MIAGWTRSSGRSFLNANSPRVGERSNTNSGRKFRLIFFYNIFLLNSIFL
jgi:hypothetical protein